MKKTVLLCLLVTALCACNWFHKKPSALPANETVENSTVSAENSLPQTSVNVTETSSEKTSKNSTAKSVPSKKESTPVVLAETSVADDTLPEQAETLPFAFTPQDAKAVIAERRAAQTLPAPQADTPVFKKEDLIPLDGRRLSPFAYEPVAQEKTAAPWSQEELKYGVYYSFIKAGTAYIKNRGMTSVNGRKAYLIQTSAFSASAIDTVFKVRDINFSWIDAENYSSLGYTQSLREGNYVRDEWVTFDYPNNRYYGEVKKKDEPREVAGELTSEVLDMLSSLYYVRAQKLEIGKDIVFDIINREERYPLVVKVVKKETVKTSAGKFHCIMVEPQFRGEGIFVSKGKSLKVWLTDDKYKMPVKMQTEVFIGSVSAELLEYKRN